MVNRWCSAHDVSGLIMTVLVAAVTAAVLSMRRVAVCLPVLLQLREVLSLSAVCVKITSYSPSVRISHFCGTRWPTACKRKPGTPVSAAAIQRTQRPSCSWIIVCFWVSDLQGLAQERTRWWRPLNSKPSRSTKLVDS